MRLAVAALLVLFGCDAPSTLYRRDVAPILATHCVQCHRERGDAPFALDTFARTASRAREIAHATAQRRMPPWPIGTPDGCPPVLGRRGLSPDEITTLSRWWLEGAEEGSGPLPPPPPTPEDALERVDLVVQPAAGYVPRPREDDYRCFLVDPGLTEDQFVTAFAVRPEVPGIIHHLLAFSVDTAEAEAALRPLAEAEDGPGFDCAVFPEVSVRYVTVWSPGDPVRRHPAGSGLRLRAGRPLLLQVHYHDHGMALPDRPAIELELTRNVELEAMVWSMAAVLVLPPGQARVQASGGRGPLDGTYRIWGARPHMHGLGRSVRIDVRSEGQDACVMSLDRWDAAVQPMYFLDAPVVAGPGSEIRVTCTYDTTSRNTPTFWGWGTADEMCFAHVYVTR